MGDERDKMNTQELVPTGFWNKCLHGLIYLVCALVIAAAFSLASAINLLA